ALAYRMGRKIAIGQMYSPLDPNVIAYPAIFIENGIFNIATLADTNWRRLLGTAQCNDFFQVFVMVSPHHISSFNDRSPANPRSNANHGALQLISIEDTSVCYDRIIQRRTRYLRGWQHPCTGKDGFVKEVKIGHIIGQTNVRFKKRADRSDICPIPIKLIAQYFPA